MQTGFLKPTPAPGRRSPKLAVALSLLIHGLALFALVSAAPHAAQPARSDPVLIVSLAAASHMPRISPRLTPALTDVHPTAAPTQSKTAAAPPRTSSRPVSPVRTALRPAAFGRGVLANTDAIDGAELAGATAAGSGSVGDCDIAARLQAVLRRDRLVQAELAHIAVSGARALRIWNGDWVAHPGQDGHGLAAVREAILWEVGFSPPHCRRESVHGLVLLVVPVETGEELSLALGKVDWRWSDLLGLGAAQPPS